MFKQSPTSRSYKSKGFKVKHAIQISILLAISIWLLYQVKHSHDKKKTYIESTNRFSEKVQSQNEVRMFGRKELHPQVAFVNEKNKEEEENVEEDTNHNEEESKSEESEDVSGGGGGDDEIGEHDHAKAKVEGERNEDSEDGENDTEKEDAEKETQQSDNEGKESEKKDAEKDDAEKGQQSDSEEKASEEKEGKIENTHSFEDQDGSDRNIQDAREGNYKGDDASSAVVHGISVTNNEADKEGHSNSNEEAPVEKTEENEHDQENTANKDEVTSSQNDSVEETGDVKSIETNPSVNAATAEEQGSEITSSASEMGSSPNSTTTAEPDNQSEAENTSIVENAVAPSAHNEKEKDSMSTPVNEHSTQTDVKSSSGGESSDLRTVVMTGNKTEETGASDGVDSQKDENSDSTANVTEDMGISNEGESIQQTDVQGKVENFHSAAGMEQLESNSKLSTTNENDTAEGKSGESSSDSETVVPAEPTIQSDSTAAEAKEDSATSTNENANTAQSSETTSAKEEAEGESASSTVDENANTAQDSKSETKEAENNSGSSTVTENVDSAQDSKSETTIKTTEAEDIPESSTENVDSAQSNDSGTTVVKDKAEDHSASSTVDRNAYAAQNNESETTAIKEEVEGNSASSTENENKTDKAQSKPVDSSDSSIPEELKGARTDLGTLPEVETNGENRDDTTAE